jgi:hypothetical protein
MQQFKCLFHLSSCSTCFGRYIHGIMKLKSVEAKQANDYFKYKNTE